jgi:outer membrane protein assembly factor BamD (BamD/ComL family)
MLAARSLHFSVRLFLLALAIVGSSMVARAQGPARGRIDPPRDETLEISAKHNLDVARWYMTKRKAFDGARDRLQEIIDTYPQFSRMDEVLFLMGEAHVKLDMVEKAAGYYEKMLKDYPDSEFAKKARARLDELKTDQKKGQR